MTTGGTDDINTTGVYVGFNCLTGLDGISINSLTVDVDDAHVSLITERRCDDNFTTANAEQQATLSYLTLRWVIVANGK